jgi:hypothetical protein
VSGFGKFSNRTIRGSASSHRRGFLFGEDVPEILF